MSERVDVTDEMVRRLAELAELPLAPGREAAVAATLAAWLPAANELSRKMSEQRYWAITPITVFVHPPSGGGESPWQ